MTMMCSLYTVYPSSFKTIHPNLGSTKFIFYSIQHMNIYTDSGHLHLLLLQSIPHIPSNNMCLPKLREKMTSLPYCKRNDQITWTWMWPFKAAQCRGVFPSSFWTLTFC
jgi:hypothetical protein